MSSVCQGYILKYPQNAIQGFSPVEFRVLDIIINRISCYGNHIPIDQIQIAKTMGCARETVCRAFKKFRDLGLIVTTRRFNQSCLVSITNFFSFPRIRAAIAHLFTRYPLFKVSLSMLLVEIVTLDLKNKDTKSKILNPEKKDIYISLKSRVSYTRARPNSVKKERKMAKIDLLVEKVRKIEAALVARGTKEVIDRYKFFLFSEECLDFASKRMVHSKPSKPFAYFLDLCFSWCKENNREIDTGMYEFMRSTGLFDNKKPVYAERPIRQQLQTGSYVSSDFGAKNQSYEMELRRHAELQKERDRKAKANFEAYKARHPVKLLNQEEKDLTNKENPFLKIMIEAGKKRLLQLDPESQDAEIIRNELVSWGVYV